MIDRLAKPYPTAKVAGPRAVQEVPARPDRPAADHRDPAAGPVAVHRGLIGIVNTLLLSVYERTREIGLLRAVGETRGQLRRSVSQESVIITLLGTFLGLVIGLVFAWALVRALADQHLERVLDPVGQLVGYVIVAIVIGIVAALYPAFRASRLERARSHRHGLRPGAARAGAWRGEDRADSPHERCGAHRGPAARTDHGRGRPPSRRRPRVAGAMARGRRPIRRSWPTCPTRSRRSTPSWRRSPRGGPDRHRPVRHRGRASG